MVGGRSHLQMMSTELEPPQKRLVDVPTFRCPPKTPVQKAYKNRAHAGTVSLLCRSAYLVGLSKSIPQVAKKGRGGFPWLRVPTLPSAFGTVSFATGFDLLARFGQKHTGGCVCVCVTLRVIVVICLCVARVLPLFKEQ